VLIGYRFWNEACFLGKLTVIGLKKGAAFAALAAFSQHFSPGIERITSKAIYGTVLLW
jgi:hypothetical protein